MPQLPSPHKSYTNLPEGWESFEQVLKVSPCPDTHEESLELGKRAFLAGATVAIHLFDDLLKLPVAERKGVWDQMISDWNRMVTELTDAPADPTAVERV